VLPLRSGDRLYLYSDGLTEAASPAGERFGRGRLLTALRAGRDAPLQESLSLLLEAVEQWCGTARLKDDASLLAVEIAPEPSA